LRFIREHVREPLTVGDVLAEAHMCRRSLERRFRAALGRSPRKEIMRVKIEHAKRLLAETNWHMSRIAAEAGLPSAEKLSVNFKRFTGMTPTEYRKRFRSP
jgi:transcriptional regulator GlxA family with amidase domain